MRFTVEQESFFRGQDRMPQQHFDKSSKWMLQAQGRGILFLAGAHSVRSCKALQAEVVQPRSLPDGLLEVVFTAGEKAELVLVEVATYAEKRIVEQVVGDLMLVRQARGVLPETMVLVLRQRGKYRVPSEWSETSAKGWSKGALSWKVIELWALPAEELLAAPDVGIVPWVILAQHEGTPEGLLRRCRERIDREGGQQRANLLAVAQVFTRLRYDRPEHLEIFGGQKAMKESPLILELQEEARQEGLVLASRNHLLDVLRFRFENQATEVSELEKRLLNVTRPEAMERLYKQAYTCETLLAFGESLSRELAPPPPSTRGKRRSGKPSS
jgi:predicted transposase YdaD